MTAVDVVVVGGGPAGSTVARRLATAGRRVLVVDAARFPRVKLCAGWVTRAALADVGVDPATYPHTIQPFAAVSLGVDAHDHETHWGHTASYGIVRVEFDAHLLARAAAAGAEVREGVRVRGVRRVPDGIAIDVDGETIRAPLVIGAGGHQCPVARALGAVRADEDVIVTQESETRVGAAQLRPLTPRYGSPELFAEPDFHGYGWYFTKGDFLNVGIGAQHGSVTIAKRLERLLARLRACGRLPATLALAPFRGHAYTVRRDRPRRIAGPGFLLVGDSAGLARDVSGEGIGPAVRSACLAAEAIADGGPARYAERIEATFGRPSRLLARLAAAVPDGIVLAAARVACAQPWLRRRLLLEGAFGIG